MLTNEVNPQAYHLSLLLVMYVGIIGCRRGSEFGQCFVNDIILSAAAADSRRTLISDGKWCTVPIYHSLPYT
eukprot:scaffold40171_cov59-Cyclotella_meneghiniana.AAC.9